MTEFVGLSCTEGRVGGVIYDLHGLSQELTRRVFSEKTRALEDKFAVSSPDTEFSPHQHVPIMYLATDLRKRPTTPFYDYVAKAAHDKSEDCRLQKIYQDLKDTHGEKEYRVGGYYRELIIDPKKVRKDVIVLSISRDIDGSHTGQKYLLIYRMYGEGASSRGEIKRQVAAGRLGRLIPLNDCYVTMEPFLGRFIEE